jgi:hypothetical protein
MLSYINQPVMSDGQDESQTVQVPVWPIGATCWHLTYFTNLHITQEITTGHSNANLNLEI